MPDLKPGSAFILEILSDARFGPTPYDGLFVVNYCPDTPYGHLAIDASADPFEARTFSSEEEAMAFIMQVSRVEPTRPHDGEPNRPLTGLMVAVVEITIIETPPR